MNNRFSNKLYSQRWTGLIVAATFLAAPNLASAQQGSWGNTYVSNSGQATLFGAHTFTLGADAPQPGIIKTARTAPFGIVGFAATASHTGAADASHVDGYVRKYGTGAFTFPIGNGTKYRPASISAPTSGEFTAAYWSQSPGTATLPAGAPFPVTNLGTNVLAVSNVEYWDVDGPSAINLTLTWDAASNLGLLPAATISNIVVVGYSTSTNKWESLGRAGGTTGTLAGTGSVTANGVTPDNYSAFTFGLANIGTPNLNPTVEIDNTSFVDGESRDFALYVNETLGYPTTVPIIVRITRLSGWDITIPGITLSSTDQSGVAGTAMVNGGTTYDNQNWVFRQNAGSIFATSKPGVTISGFGAGILGFKATRKAGTPKGTSQSITGTILDNSGGETDNTDNLVITSIIAN